MPFNRQTFDQTAERIWATAQQNLINQGYVAQVLLGFDRRGQSVQILAVAPDNLHDPEAEKLGIQTVPGSIAAHEDMVRTFLAAHVCVAAIYVSESWVVHGAAAAEVTATGGRAADHPDRIEAVTLHAAWPREFYDKVHAAPIVRDPDGANPRPGEWPADLGTPPTDRSYVDGLLTRILPGPPGRR